MKELKLLTEWADSLLNEVDGKNPKGNLPINQDPIKQTQIKNPHLSRDEAASKYLDDITKNFLDQNQVINAQRRENDKLKKTVADIAREVGDIEQDSSQTHGELERLKSLSGQLKTDVTTRRISQSEVADILNQVKGLQGKPGISSEEYQELKQKVAEFKKSEVDPKQFEELKNRLERMGTQKSVDKGDFERLQALMTKVEQGQAEVERDRGDINSKIADIERKQAEIEQREKGHDEQVKAEVEKEIKRAEEKRKRSTRASYNTSKRRLDKLEPRVDTLEPEIHKQEEINKKQDEKDSQHDEYLKRHDAELERLGSGDYRVRDRNHPTSMFTPGGEFDSLSSKEDVRHNHDLGDRDTGIEFTASSDYGNLYSRAENLLATHKINGQVKTATERIDDLKKVRLLMKTFNNNLKRKVFSFYNSKTKDGFPPEELEDVIFDVNTKYKKIYDDLLSNLSIVSGIPKKQIGPVYRDAIDLLSRHLPESLNSDLNNLAESILGEQYAKYLK